METQEIEENRYKKVNAYLYACCVYQEQTGNDLRSVIRECLENMQKIFQDLEDKDQWKKLSTEINRMIGYAKLDIYGNDQ